MLPTVLILSSICSIVRSSGVPGALVHAASLPEPSVVQATPVIPGAVAPAPVVTAASSQYFERTFNRLVAAPPPVLEPVIPVAPPPPVFVQSVAKAVPSGPAVNVQPAHNIPVDPNVAIAIATAHAAAPVATILLPPYPFGPPPTIGFIPPVPPINVPDDESRKEATTQATTKTIQNNVREPESTTPLPLPSNTDNSFAQAPQSNQNVNFRVYGPPLPPPSPRPQKLRTSVEIVPVPLRYIAPPPIVAHSHHKPIRHVHTFLPTRLIIRPVSRPVRIRTVVPARLVVRTPITSRNAFVGNPQNTLRVSPGNREIEPTTFRPLNRPNTKPPRV